MEYYELARNKKKMIEAYYHLQDHKALERIVNDLDESDPLLGYIARLLTTEGDYETAINAYLKVPQ